MASDSTWEDSPDHEADQPPTPSRNPHPQLQGFWFWFPIAAATLGSAVIGLLFGLSAFAAYSAQLVGYTIAFSITGTALTLAPPAAVAVIVRWINRELRKDEDA